MENDSAEANPPLSGSKALPEVATTTVGRAIPLQIPSPTPKVISVLDLIRISADAEIWLCTRRVHAPASALAES